MGEAPRPISRVLLIRRRARYRENQSITSRRSCYGWVVVGSGRGVAHLALSWAAFCPGRARPRGAASGIAQRSLCTKRTPIEPLSAWHVRLG
jgi:hypothetical protein